MFIAFCWSSRFLTGKFLRAQDVKLTIRGVSDSGQTIEINQATTVQTDQTQIVIMRIGELGSGSYTLTAKGNAPIVFDQTTELTYVHKSYSVFIQTDKAIYRAVHVEIFFLLGII